VATELTKTDLQKLRGRDWNAVREAWLSYIPSFPYAGARPEESSDSLLEAQGFSPPLDSPHRMEEIPGIRSSVLWESVCMYQKAKHARTAAADLKIAGYETWSLFNHYHSAYLAAKGLMYLLGVTVPLVKSKRFLLDIYAPPENDRSGKRIAVASLTDFMSIPLPGLDQHQLWAWFQRLLASARSVPWDKTIAREIHLITESRDFVRQRNGLLYRPGMWVADDLIAPLNEPWPTPLQYGLDVELPDFLESLSDHVHSIFDAAIADISKTSSPIRTQMMAAVVATRIASIN
jgi:hypothetical protein